MQPENTPDPDHVYSSTLDAGFRPHLIGLADYAQVRAVNSLNKERRLRIAEKALSPDKAQHICDLLGIIERSQRIIDKARGGE